MKKLLIAMFLLVGCSVETKLPIYDIVYVQRPVEKIENAQ